MRVAPPSADLLIKLALAAAVVGAVVYGARKVAGAAGALPGAVADAASAAGSYAVGAVDTATSDPWSWEGIVGWGGPINPVLNAASGARGLYEAASSPDNVVYPGVNALGHAVATSPTAPGKNADGSWTLGGFVYDIFH